MLPEEKLRAYSISVDKHDSVWLTDFSANAIGRFDPQNDWSRLSSRARRRTRPWA
jgi:streptogramin lyase